MEKTAAYLISLAIIGFGLWIFFAAEAEPVSLLVWFIIGLMPVAVGLWGLIYEIDNDLFSRRSR